jgi:predicted nucleic acid-binding protein
MILIDTSVWVDHLRNNGQRLSSLLEAGQRLPQVRVATDLEVLHLIDQNLLFGTGIGYVDAHILAALRLNPGTSLLTRDKRLLAAAAKLGASSRLH